MNTWDMVRLNERLGTDQDGAADKSGFTHVVLVLRAGGVGEAQ
jgi:hypothetical protein